MVLVDANVLIDLFTNDGTWADWSEQALTQTSATEEVGINPIIYAEVSIAFKHAEPLDKALKQLAVTRLELPYEAAFLAGKAFFEYRRHGGLKRSPLQDFYIGAHAQYGRFRLLTRDPKRYRTYFPEVDLIAPEK